MINTHLILFTICLLWAAYSQQTVTTTTITTAVAGNLPTINNGYGPNTIGPINLQTPGIENPITSIRLRPGITTTFYLTPGLLSDLSTLQPILGFTYSYEIKDKPQWVNYYSNNKSFTAAPPANWNTTNNNNPSKFNLSYSDSRNNRLDISVEMRSLAANEQSQMIYVVLSNTQPSTTPVNPNLYTIVYPVFTTTTTNLSSIRSNNYGIVTNINKIPWTTFQLVKNSILHSQAVSSSFAQAQGSNSAQSVLYNQINNQPIVPLNVQPVIPQNNQGFVPSNQGTYMYSTNNAGANNQGQLTTTQITRTVTQTLQPGQTLNNDQLNFNSNTQTTAVPSQNIPNIAPVVNINPQSNQPSATSWSPNATTVTHTTTSSIVGVAPTQNTPALSVQPTNQFTQPIATPQPISIPQTTQTTNMNNQIIPPQNVNVQVSNVPTNPPVVFPTSTPTPTQTTTTTTTTTPISTTTSTPILTSNNNFGSSFSSGGSITPTQPSFQPQTITPLVISPTTTATVSPVSGTTTVSTTTQQFQSGPINTIPSSSISPVIPTQIPGLVSNN